MAVQGATLRRVNEEWYSVDEIAERLKVSTFTVRRWLREGVLRGRKLPGTRSWRIPESDLQAFLSSEREREAPRT
jgi:excisionase family DNA binding protein